jgi:hypothetical protein
MDVSALLHRADSADHEVGQERPVTVPSKVNCPFEYCVLNTCITWCR